MTLSFDPDTAEVIFHDTDNLVAKRGDVVLLVCRRPMKLPQMKELAAVVGARALRPVVDRGAYVTVLEDSADKPMTAPLREQQSALLRQLLAADRAWAATIVPSAFLLRSALKVLSLGAPATYRTFKKPREAAEWLAGHVAVPALDLRAFVAWGRQLEIQI